MLQGVPGINQNTNQPENQRIKPREISGFPEYSPKFQTAFQQAQDRIRSIFELNGYSPLETPVVERLEVLAAKGGDSDKEMYALQRVNASESDGSDARLGLRYDLTVPLARYVGLHFNELTFPYLRYQIGSCFRGERPQEGRYRQFTQCDIDVLDVDNVAFSYDIEIPKLVYKVLKDLEIGNFEFRISNRKILHGFLAALQISNPAEVTRELDKIDKVGPNNVASSLLKLGVPEPAVKQSLALAAISSYDDSFVNAVRSLGVKSEALEAGLQDLCKVITDLNRIAPGVFKADLSITRGFNYYTGSVYEVKWLDFPSLGSIAAGGRYDDLASSFINRKIPGVGMSIGLSRIFSKLVKEGRLSAAPRCKTVVLLAVTDESRVGEINEIADTLRARGIATQVFPEVTSQAKQLKYADKLGIRYVVFDKDMQIKDMSSRLQGSFDANTWMPDTGAKE
jgi:histidyl-tRNA synthetase